MRKALTLLMAFAFMGSLATANHHGTPPGGGDYILVDDFDGPATDPYWNGSAAAADREDIFFVRGGSVPGDGGNGEWETWPFCCEPGGGSGSRVNKDGNGNMTMEMVAPPWSSYVDARGNGAETVAGTSYAVICSLTMPDSGGMFFGWADPGGTVNTGVKCVGGSIYWAEATTDIWNGATANDLDTGATYTAGEQFTAMYYISTAGDVEVWWHAGRMTVTNGPGWVDITPAGATYTPNQPERMALHTIAAATAPETDLCVVDYVAWIENPNMIPVELSDFTLE